MKSFFKGVFISFIAVAVALSASLANAGVWSVEQASASTLAPDYPTFLQVTSVQSTAIIAQTHGHPNASPAPVGGYCENIIDANGNVIVRQHMSYTILWSPPTGAIKVKRGVMKFWRQTCL